MRRVLVAGGRGFIGSWVVNELAAQSDTQVVSADNRPVRRSRVSKNCKQIQLDFCNTRELVGELTTTNSVINLAGASSQYSVSEMVRANVTATQSLLQAVAVTGTRVVHVSSSSVYGEVEDIRFADETSNLVPVGTYAQTKVEGELLFSESRKRGRVRGTIFRPFTVVGPGQEVGRARPILPALVRAAFAESEFLLQGDGSQVRDFVSVKDVARILAAAALTDLELEDPVNIGTGIPTTVLELCSLVEAAARKKIGLTCTADKCVAVARSSFLADTRRMTELFPGEMEALDSVVSATVRSFDEAC